MMFRKELLVEASPEQLGRLFAESNGELQQAFLESWADAASEFCWPMQCRDIADGMTADKQAAVASVLQDLIDHLDE